MPVLCVPDVAPVSQAELDHLASLKPDNKASGYKGVFPSTHADGWRVRVKTGGVLHSLPRIYRHPRDAAKAMVRFYRHKCGPEWTKLIKPGYNPPKERGPILHRRAGYGFLIHEQAPGEWVITAVVFGKQTMIDKPGRRVWFHTYNAAKIYLGMWCRNQFPLLGLLVLLPNDPVEVEEPTEEYPWPLADEWRRQAKIRPKRPRWCKARFSTPPFPACVE
jgi:hypothetical protein